MMENRSVSTQADVGAFIAGVTPVVRQAEARRLDQLFRGAIGFRPRMWGSSIIGYGRYAYRYDSGRTGESCATGFSPRARAISVYIMPGFSDHGALLGRHRMGKGCLYLARLADADPDVLAELIRAGLADLGGRYEVHPE